MDKVDLPTRTFSRSFPVMPADTNHMAGVIFGGKFMAEIDLTCAMLARRALYASPTCSQVYTYIVENITFTAPSHTGDMIFIEAEIVELRRRSIRVTFKGYVEECKTGVRSEVAFGSLVFVSHEDGVVQPHHLKFPERP